MADTTGRQATPEESRDALISWLQGPNRRRRQDAARELRQIVAKDVEMGMPIIPQLVDALLRPEAQTRWESLDALADIALVHPEAVEDAFDGAEEALFDEDSIPVRLKAFRFMCAYGSTSEDRSDQVWPLLDEAIQCYHGDVVYREMLQSLVDFARGSISPKTAEAMVARISFDAKNGHGYIRNYSAEILQTASARQ